MPDDVDIEQIIETALAHHQAGQLDLAEAAYRTVLQLDPNNPDALNPLGLIALGRGDLDDAIALAQRTAGRPAMAVDAARRAIAFDPDLAQAHLQLGAALIDLGENAAAAEALRNANHLAPGSQEAQVALATALTRLQDDTPKPNNRGALIGVPIAPSQPERLDAAPAAQPGDADALHRLGVLRHRQGNPMQAVELLTRALAINPNDQAYRDLDRRRHRRRSESRDQTKRVMTEGGIAAGLNHAIKQRAR